MELAVPVRRQARTQGARTQEARTQAVAAALGPPRGALGAALRPPLGALAAAALAARLWREAAVRRQLREVAGAIRNPSA